MRGRTAALVFGISVLAGAQGCADNAILTMYVRLPLADGVRNFAYVQARSGEEDDLILDWDERSSLDGFLLLPESLSQELSIEARGDQVERPLLVKIRYCMMSQCAGDTAPRAEQHFVFERAFYFGERTRYETDLAIPASTTPDVVHVDRCEVFGCIGGSSTSGCAGDDGMGPHYCEQ